MNLATNPGLIVKTEATKAPDSCSWPAPGQAPKPVPGSLNCKSARRPPSPGARSPSIETVFEIPGRNVRDVGGEGGFWELSRHPPLPTRHPHLDSPTTYPTLLANT